ncbi:MAG: hypothetical protein LBC75_08475 [Fibromonadaceae bacterium]|jgi:hypothetical protein|nr:hypothetical protein [Fibromonadaceae bacterium]
MESILSLIVNAENVRMLVTLVFGFSCFVWLKTSLEKKIDRLEHKLDSKIDSVESSLKASMRELTFETEASINGLKYNDFAHLMNAFVALTYVLEKNHILSKEDKEYVDSRLALECPSPS